MICIGVAGVVAEVLPLQRSYWVPLTVALVLKPDYGSVFERALQRGIGTIVGAVAGAVLLALVHGTWLLIPFAVLAALPDDEVLKPVTGAVRSLLGVVGSGRSA